MGIIGSIVGGIFGMGSANKAANAQVQASKQAAGISQQALDFQKQMWAQTQANEAPWLKAGGMAETELSSLLGTPGQGLLTPWAEQFQAPTSVTEQNDPGYQFRLQQGAQALQNSAAARGGLLSGNTAKALEDYSQNYASNEYGNVYSRAYNEYATRYNQFQQNQANEFNRLSSLAGGGQVAAGQLGQLGQAAANNVGYLAGQQGQFLQNAGAARASGYIGSNNQFQSMLGNLQGNMLLASLGIGAFKPPGGGA